MIKLRPRSSARFKGLLFLLGIVTTISVLWYTQQLVNTLKVKSTEFVQFRIKIFEQNINNPTSDVDVNFFFNEVIQKADYPIIYTDSSGRPQSWKNIAPRIDSLTTLNRQDSLLLVNTLKQIAGENKPIPIKYQNAVLGYYYYGYPPEIYKLRTLPFFIIGAGIVFILLGYFGFTYIKRSEQRSIWVGLSKETAHQLGTPLSSLSGWIELLASQPDNADEIIREMGNDLSRLNKIANRFSKIGSVPRLKPGNLSKVLNGTISYFQNRLPHLNRRITLTAEIPDNVTVAFNTDLFEWVMENIIKNAIDSMVDEVGKIEVKLGQNEKYIMIDICDTGKGILPKHKTVIFKPGFSTKKRGWGLGLSLSKRIIEEYHKGKLILAASKPGEGSTFRIYLPR